LRENIDGEYSPVETHIPLHLNWSNRQDSESIYVPRINEGQYRYWDLFHILDPQGRSILPGESPSPDDRKTTFINVDTYLKPTSFSYLLEPGTYRMRVIVSASNSKPTETIFEVKCDGKWYPQEYEMLGSGLSVMILEQKVGS